MPPSIPLPPPALAPDPEALDLMARVRRFAAPPPDADADAYARRIAGLQHLAATVHDEWLRTLARAQGAHVLSHRALARVAGYSQHRSVQDRVYEGRELLAADAARNAQEAG